MVVDSEDTSTVPTESTSERLTSNIENLTTVTNNESIKIILFPPPNKKFRFDKETNSIRIQATNEKISDTSTSEVTVCGNNNLNEIKFDTTKHESGLTPLIENCNISTAVSFPSDEKSVSGSCSPQKLTILENCNNSIREVLKIDQVFKKSKLGKHCFLKGCKWSPDGLCLLSNSDDNTLRLFETSEDICTNFKNDLQPVLQMKEGGTIYDFDWYPLMNSLDPVSCVIASASQDSPIHLWDAYTGSLRATYQPINQFDEVTPAFSVVFSPNGSKIYSGYKKFLRIFDTSQPGRVFEERALKTKEYPIYQTNIVSTLCINPAIPTLLAIGCYDKTVGVYSEPQGDLLFILKGHSGGITQVKFSPDGLYLFSGGRKDPEILCWDMRNPGKVLYCIKRRVETQQKIQFDVTRDGKFLITGSTDCNLNFFNLLNSPNEQNVLEPIECWRGHEDCVNGVSFHPNKSLFASASGQRHFPSVQYEDEDDEGNESDDADVDVYENNCIVENSLKIWSFNVP